MYASPIVSTWNIFVLNSFIFRIVLMKVANLVGRVVRDDPVEGLEDAGEQSDDLGNTERFHFAGAFVEHPENLAY